MLDFISFILIGIGLAVILYGVALGMAHIFGLIAVERERRRKHEQHLLTLLTRIADNTEPKS